MAAKLEEARAISQMNVYDLTDVLTMRFRVVCASALG
jgi:hypothetical protein